MNRFVPLFSMTKMSNKNALQRFKACARNIESLEADPTLLDRVVISDEHMVPLKVREPGQNPRKAKHITVVPFFDRRGLIFNHVTEPGANINAEYFELILRDFRSALDRNRPDVLDQVKPVPLLIDNATWHNSPRVMTTIDKLHMKRLAHPSYSPDLNPCDFYLFKSLNDLIIRRVLISGFITEGSISHDLQTLLSGDTLESLFREMSRRWVLVCLRQLSVTKLMFDANGK